MKQILLLSSILSSLFLSAQQNTETYPVDSASVEHPGVPKGEVLKFTFNQSKIFPGTIREVSVYVPAQYKADKPACVYVNQDGIQWKAPTVFDNLIYKKEMPITIGVFVTPGKVLADDGAVAQDRYNAASSMMDWEMLMHDSFSQKFCLKLKNKKHLTVVLFVFLKMETIER